MWFFKMHIVDEKLFTFSALKRSYNTQPQN